MIVSPRHALIAGNVTSTTYHAGQQGYHGRVTACMTIVQDEPRGDT